MTKDVRCQAMISSEIKCRVVVTYNFMSQTWNHQVNDSYTDHEVVLPEGTQVPKNLIEELMEDTVGKFEKARAKYEPLVKNLTDMDFAGLFKVVMAERDRRITILMVTHPFIARQAAEDLRKQFAEQEAEVNKRVQETLAQERRN